MFSTFSSKITQRLAFKNITKFKSNFDTSFFKFQKFTSSVYVNHRDTDYNNDKTPFDFTPENYIKVEEILVYNNLIIV